MNKKLILPIQVIGIGASAGGLEPLQVIISHLPKKLSSTVIIIAQHLSPDYKSMLAELLARKTEIPVKQAENGMLIQENTIYIAPPNADALVVKKIFHLNKPVDGGAHPSVDLLFASLAKEFGKRAGGIVLSGTGKDGTKGILAIKRVGGTTIVQDTQTAKYDGMPKSALSTGIIDHVLSPEQIGDHFEKLFTNGETRLEAIKDHSVVSDSSFLQIFDLLERRIGVDFTDYKTSTLSRRLHKRLTEKKFDNEQEYLDYIRQNPEELDRLFEEILIGVTSFFRDPYAFKAVEKILQKIIYEKKSGESLRIWIPGCATGEEAYTYAIIIREILEESGKLLPLQIFATDIDIRALHKARLGVYTVSAIATVPRNLLAKYFTKVNTNTYELNKEIRKMVLFSRHDVTSNPPFLRLDLISCRNLLIYFNVDLQKRVIPLFYYALNANGYLVFGKSENIGLFDNLFFTRDSSYKIFQRKPSDGKSIKLPHFRHTKTRRIISTDENIVREDLSVSEMVKETLYNNFDHPYVVIDESMDIVEVHGDISLYLKFKEGSATLNFMKLIIPQLQIESRAVISKAITNNKQEKGMLRKITIDNKTYFLQLSVKPVLYSKSNTPYFIVIFEKIHLDEKIFKISNQQIEEKDATRLIELEQELDATKEHMNSLIEELETSNEELQALNEEMQASKEELQASNEELETSNEELQATNEELENAYSELREANKQISQQKDEIELAAQRQAMLLNNTLVGFILINRDYQVVSYNKTAADMYKKLFHTELTEGISLIKVLPDMIFPTFHINFRKAMAGNQIVMEEVISLPDKNSVYLDFNYTPVKLVKNEKEPKMIAVSFVDITKRKQAELELNKALENLSREKRFMETLAESLPNIIWTTDAEGIYQYCNQQFLTYTGISFKELKKFSWKPFIHPNDWKKTSQLWRKSLKSGEKLVLEHRLKNSKGMYRWHITLATAIRNADNNSTLWVGSSTDIHEQKLLDERKNEFISVASHELKTPVTSLKAYIHVLNLLAEKKEQNKLLDTIGKMDTQLNRLTKLINDLLDVSKIESGKLLFNKKDFNFDELIDEVVDSMQLIFQRYKIERNGTLPITITSDRDRIEQVMINFISNAVKYSPDSKRVIIKAEKNHKNLIFSVKDFGIGIPTDKQEKIFNRFYRVDGKSSQTFPGMGLGLYISSEIIKRLGGTIGFESKEGEGSTFYFTLPVKT